MSTLTWRCLSILLLYGLLAHGDLVFRLNARRFIRPTTGFKTNSSATAANASGVTSNNNGVLPFKLRPSHEDHKPPHPDSDSGIEEYGMKMRSQRNDDGDAVNQDPPIVLTMQRAYDWDAQGIQKMSV